MSPPQPESPAQRAAAVPPVGRKQMSDGWSVTVSERSPSAPTVTGSTDGFNVMTPLAPFAKPPGDPAAPGDIVQKLAVSVVVVVEDVDVVVVVEGVVVDDVVVVVVVVDVVLVVVVEVVVVLVVVVDVVVLVVVDDVVVVVLGAVVDGPVVVVVVDVV